MSPRAVILILVIRRILVPCINEQRPYSGEANEPMGCLTIAGTCPYLRFLALPLEVHPPWPSWPPSYISLDISMLLEQGIDRSRPLRRLGTWFKSWIEEELLFGRCRLCY